ncbi:hypothetical protein Poly24_16670 [Rosistilla carotiformis]|uniref:TIGR04255 family protein n=1 Tax=Rosistilla carotiformis TaxID=2528017 RepID=A0A518JQY6_9BACT|nr:hypothetical protein [Rosistilla carotiformis]QDV67961.1 hypothetical protein Poly24_16670 [Rosistilla carotiformis]
MSGYDAFSDDYYMNMHLSTELDMPRERESVMHFFEQIQRRYQSMQNFYAREKNEFVLEEEKDAGQYNWASVEPRRVSCGSVNPKKLDDVVAQHRSILEIAPYALSISPLECESLSVMFGFDFTFRGNQNELLAEALGVLPAFEKALEVPGAALLSHEPSIQFSLDDQCRTQCRIGFETRTTAYQIRTNDFSEDQLSVYLTVRRFDSLSVGESFVEEYDRLAAKGRSLVEDYLIENVLRPLQQTIALH